jgi:hypothetical protein
MKIKLITVNQIRRSLNSIELSALFKKHPFVGITYHEKTVAYLYPPSITFDRNKKNEKITLTKLRETITDCYSNLNNNLVNGYIIYNGNNGAEVGILVKDRLQETTKRVD